MRANNFSVLLACIALPASPAIAPANKLSTPLSDPIATRRRRRARRGIAIAASAAALALLAAPACAVEGGSSPYLRGSPNFMAGILPPGPALYLTDMYAYMDGSVGAEVRNGLIETDVSTKVNGLLLFASYVTDDTFLGARYGVGGALSYLNVKLHADIAGPLGTVNANLGTAAIGDSLLEPVVLGWDSGNWHWVGNVFVFVPTGEYNKGQLSTGRNYWGVMPQFSLTYYDPKEGWDASATLTYVTLTENTATQYQSGDILHVDFSGGYHFVALGGEWEAGLAGNVVDQVSPDSGAGAKLGPNEAQSVGLGPMITYSSKLNGLPVAFSARWEHDVNASKTFGGNLVYVTATVVV
jgi:hypothetical protein